MSEGAANGGGEVVLTATSADGGVVAIRATSDGFLAVVRDGVETSPARWTRDQWDACVAEFSRRAGLVPPSPGNSPAGPGHGGQSR